MTRDRIDAASRVIAASPEALYQAFVDPESLVQWLPPSGMSCRIHAFHPVQGGSMHLSLYYDAGSGGRGKSSEDEDELRARFLELVPGRRITYEVEFQSDDPRHAGTMTQTWTFEPAAKGTTVTISCLDVPEGISAEDHAAGMGSTLANLAAFAVERRGPGPGASTPRCRGRREPGARRPPTSRRGS